MQLSYRPGNADDEEASDRAEAFEVGIFSQPVYGDGNYPKIVRDTLGSMIPNLTEQDKELIKGSADFYAIGEDFELSFLDAHARDPEG